MREEEGNWFAKWEEELPSPDELMPLSQTLITPDLAVAFDIRNLGAAAGDGANNNRHQPVSAPAPVTPVAAGNSHMGGANSSAEFGADSSELGSGAGGGDEPARTLKRPRLVWTPQLHKRFVDAVAHLGIKNAVPKTIMQLMSVDGLTRENVASHLQKYRLYLKRMQGLSSGGGGGGGAGGGSVADAATEHLFASSPVPAHFLHPGRGSSEHYLPFVPVAALQQQHHQQQQQMAAAAAAAAAVGAHPHLQSHYHRHMGHFGSPPNGQFGSPPNGQFDHPFLSRQTQQQQGSVHRVGANVHSSVPGYVEDLESANGNGGRKVLTLFPTADD